MGPVCPTTGLRTLSPVNAVLEYLAALTILLEIPMSKVLRPPNLMKLA